MEQKSEQYKKLLLMIFILYAKHIFSIKYKRKTLHNKISRYRRHTKTQREKTQYLFIIITISVVCIIILVGWKEKNEVLSFSFPLQILRQLF